MEPGVGFDYTCGFLLTQDILFLYGSISPEGATIIWERQNYFLSHWTHSLSDLEHHAFSKSGCWTFQWEKLQLISVCLFVYLSTTFGYFNNCLKSIIHTMWHYTSPLQIVRNILPSKMQAKSHYLWIEMSTGTREQLLTTDTLT